MIYEPKPSDTSGVKLPIELESLIERLAENAHDLWAAQRLTICAAIWFTEQTLEEEHRSWIRLMLEAEWFG